MDTEVICVIKSGLKPPPPTHACDGGDPTTNRVSLPATGRAEAGFCAGDPGPLADEAKASILVHGATMMQNGIGCASYEFGLVCANRDSHGFFLSNRESRSF